MPTKEQRIENLRRSNEASHQTVEESLREAMYKLLTKKDVADIRVTDLVNAAGVSRGVFYKHYYLVTDVLKADVETAAEEVALSISKSLDVNWLNILKKVYEYKNRIPLLIKAGLGMEILYQINQVTDRLYDVEKTLLCTWNGIIFNTIVRWSEREFEDSPEALAEQMTKATKPLFRG